MKDATFERIAKLRKTVKEHGSLEDRNRLEWIEGAYRERLMEGKMRLRYLVASVTINIVLCAFLTFIW